MPFITTQVSGGLSGCVLTVTEYGMPSGKAVAKVNIPLTFTLRSSPRLFCISTPDVSRDKDKPDTVPERVYVLTQVTTMLLTLDC